MAIKHSKISPDVSSITEGISQGYRELKRMSLRLYNNKTSRTH
jgi:hypothetical protein